MCPNLGCRALCTVAVPLPPDGPELSSQLPGELRAEKLGPCVGSLLPRSQSHTLHLASLQRCHHINIPVTIAYCQTQFRKVPVCYKYFIVLEYAIYVTCPAKEIHYTVLSD